MANILIVDDDPQLRQSFEKLLIGEGHSVEMAASAEAGIKIIKGHMPDLVIIDVRLPGMNGLEAFKIIRQIENKLPVIIMTAYGTTETAIEATKMGAFDYILKPFDIPDVLELIDKAIQAGKFMRDRVEMNVSPETAPADSIIGRSPSMQEVYKSIGRAAPTDATVLIRGESGTGKELVARALYQHSLRSEKPFLIINCVAIPDTLLESELFGYEKGAFTGAVSRRVGKIEQADQGTVFLDEIGDMPFNIQAKILRLLQEKSIERIGGRNTIPVDVRIIAATNRNLEEAVSSGRFRQDLYYRLNVVSLWLPPLRERKEDIPLLADYFSNRFKKEMGLTVPSLSTEAKDALCRHEWPGNVRELANILQKALIFNRSGNIGKEDIGLAIEDKAAIKRIPMQAGDQDSDQDIEALFQKWIMEKLTDNKSEDVFNELLDEFAGRVIREVLNMTGGNRSHAAKILGISRPTLLSKIDKYNIKIETSAV